MKSSSESSSRKTARRETSPRYTGVAFLIMGSIIAIVIALYFFNNRSLINKQLFFLLLIAFGAGLALFLFGSMKSIARLTGKTDIGKYSFSGPIVAVIVVVVGWYYLNPDPKSLTLKVRAFDRATQAPVRAGEVVLYLPGTILRQPLNNLGESEFKDISVAYADSFIRCDVLPEGLYISQTDTLKLLDNFVWNAKLQRKLQFTVQGRVTTAASVPIRDAEISILGTSLTTRSLSDGSYSLPVTNFTEQKFTLGVYHERFQDKEEFVTVSGPIINEDVILASNKNPDGN